MPTKIYVWIYLLVSERPRAFASFQAVQTAAARYDLRLVGDHWEVYHEGLLHAVVWETTLY